MSELGIAILGIVGLFINGVSVGALAMQLYYNPPEKSPSILAMLVSNLMCFAFISYTLIVDVFLR